MTLWIPSFPSCLDRSHGSKRYKKKVSDSQQPADRLSHSRPGCAGDDVTRVHRLRTRRKLVEWHVSALCAAQPLTHPEQLGVQLSLSILAYGPTRYQGGAVCEHLINT